MRSPSICLRASHPRTQLPNLTPTAWPPRPIAPHLYRPRVSWSHRRASAELPYQPHFTPPTTPLYLTTTKPPNNDIHKQPNVLSNQAKMQSTTVLVNAHSSCPKCGATIEGDNKSCGSCGSVSFTPTTAFLNGGVVREVVMCADDRRVVLPCLNQDG